MLQTVPSPLSANPENVPDVTDETRNSLFNSLFQLEKSFNIITAWRRCNIEEGELQAIQFSHCTGRLVNGIVKTVMLKKIVLCHDISMQVSILDILVENEKVGFTDDFVFSAKDVEAVIEICIRRGLVKDVLLPIQ